MTTDRTPPGGYAPAVDAREYVYGWSPLAIRQHFDGGELPHIAAWIATATDAQLAWVSEIVASDDHVYAVMSTALEVACEAVMTATTTSPPAPTSTPTKGR